VEDLASRIVKACVLEFYPWLRNSAPVLQDEVCFRAAVTLRLCLRGLVSLEDSCLRVSVLWWLLHYILVVLLVSSSLVSLGTEGNHLLGTRLLFNLVGEGHGPSTIRQSIDIVLIRSLLLPFFELVDKDWGHDCFVSA
jgi:hypothetical protein